jgi:hypothetical protein
MACGSKEAFITQIGTPDLVWFYLSVQQSSKMWECGNREAISKDGGKDGKPAFGFPGFPRAVISTSRSVSVRWSWFRM